MKQQVVRVLSTNYAGSHFLTLQLASHTRCISLGEVHQARRQGEGLIRLCHVCDSDEVCPVFRGIAGNGDINVYDRLLENLCVYAPDVQMLIDNSKKTRWASRFLEFAPYDRTSTLISYAGAKLMHWFPRLRRGKKRKAYYLCQRKI